MTAVLIALVVLLALAVAADGDAPAVPAPASDQASRHHRPAGPIPVRRRGALAAGARCGASSREGRGCDAGSGVPRARRAAPPDRHAAAPQAAVALSLQEAIEQRATAWGIPVDARIERGRTYRHTLRQTFEHERYDRIVLAAAPRGSNGFDAGDVAWLLDNAAGEIVVLRPGRDTTIEPPALRQRRALRADPPAKRVRRGLTATVRAHS